MILPDPPPDYYPFRRGQKRRYRSRAPGAPPAEYTVETLSVVSVPRGSSTATFRNTVHSRPPQVSTYDVDKTGAGIFDGGEKVLPAAPKLDDRWEAGGRDYQVVAVDEAVAVPAGIFPGCLKVQYLIAGGDAGSGARWYAPGVGLVKEACEDEADPFVSELLRLG